MRRGKTTLALTCWDFVFFFADSESCLQEYFALTNTHGNRVHVPQCCWRHDFTLVLNALLYFVTRCDAGYLMYSMDICAYLVIFIGIIFIALFRIS